MHCLYVLLKSIMQKSQTNLPSSNCVNHALIIRKLLSVLDMLGKSVNCAVTMLVNIIGTDRELMLECGHISTAK